MIYYLFFAHSLQLLCLWVFLFEQSRRKTRKKNKPDYKAYLDKTFLEELSAKLWITKGARFIANKRLNRQAVLSNNSISLLSAYLIIAGLVSVYQLTFAKLIDPNLLAFGSTTLSILVLVFSQIENAGDYKIRALRFHDCALELGKLYNAVRTYKTLADIDDISRDKILEFCNDIDKKYQDILKLYDNHDPVDYSKFQIENNEYFKFNALKYLRIKMFVFLYTSFIYYLLILIPPTIVTLFYLLKK